MPIYRDKASRRYRFEFDRNIGGRRLRTTKLLPAGWNRAQADQFDREESARLYAVAQGIERDIPRIEAAVEFYLKEKRHLKSHIQAARHLAAVYWAYQGRGMDEMAEVSTEIMKKGAGVMAPATIRQRIALVRAACRHAWKAWRVKMPDPAEHVSLPVVRNERHEYLDRKQALQLARACKKPAARAMILIAFYSGMRVAEIWRAQIMREAFVLADSKNGMPRVIPVHPAVARYAARHLPPRISYRSMMIWFRKAAIDIGRPGLHFHDLRHSAASAMIQSGVDLYTVGKVLGHADGRSTARYAHLATEQLKTAVGKISGRKTPLAVAAGAASQTKKTA